MATQRVWQNGAWKNLGVQYSDVLKFSINTPDNPNNGDLWYDTNTGQNLLKIWNGAQWLLVIQSNDSQNVVAQRMFA